MHNAQTKGHLEERDVQEIVNKIMFRRNKLKWDCSAKLIVFLQPILRLLQKVKCSKKRSGKFSNKFRRFDLAQRKFYQELDIIALLKRSRDTQNFLRISMKPEQKLLLKLSEQNLIPFPSDSQNSDEDHKKKFTDH